jgi:hypothetical protein
MGAHNIRRVIILATLIAMIGAPSAALSQRRDPVFNLYDDCDLALSRAKLAEYRWDDWYRQTPRYRIVAGGVTEDVGPDPAYEARLKQAAVDMRAARAALEACLKRAADAASVSKPVNSKPAPLEDRNPQDFPLASCKSWDGTVTKRTGIDTESATMGGIVTRANVEEYCNRIVPEDKSARDVAVAACIQESLPMASKALLAVRANCTKGTLEFSDGTETKRVQFPVAATADTSCASGMPPLIAQFRKLCPQRAAELRVE